MFSGLISCGDEVIEVNGINVEGKSPNDVLRILVIIFVFKNVIVGGQNTRNYKTRVFNIFLA
jgi:hypothetical protein